MPLRQKPRYWDFTNLGGLGFVPSLDQNGFHGGQACSARALLVLFNMRGGIACEMLRTIRAFLLQVAAGFRRVRGYMDAETRKKRQECYAVVYK